MVSTHKKQLPMKLGWLQITNVIHKIIESVFLFRPQLKRGIVRKFQNLLL